MSASKQRRRTMSTKTDVAETNIALRGPDAGVTAEELAKELAKLPLPHPFPPPLPIYVGASGLYVWNAISPPIPHPIPQPIPFVPPGPGPGPDPAPIPSPHALAPIPLLLKREELRLDVDGRYPQMVASGTSVASFVTKIHWIANLQ